MKCPCTRECPERSAECHGSCERYKAYEVEKHEEYRMNEIRAINYAESSWKKSNCRNKLLHKSHYPKGHGAR